jgi:hypothetical protein
MTGKQPLPIGLWVLALGASGFVAGFFGPMILRPDANQGPMMGIFITGPGGAALGLILGALFRFASISNARRLQTLAAVSTVFALVLPGSSADAASEQWRRVDDSGAARESNSQPSQTVEQRTPRCRRLEQPNVHSGVFHRFREIRAASEVRSGLAHQALE